MLVDFKASQHGRLFGEGGRFLDQATCQIFCLRKDDRWTAMS